MDEVKKLRKELNRILNLGRKTVVREKLQKFIEEVKKARDKARDDFLNTKELYEKNPSPELKIDLQQKQAKSAEVRQLHQEIKAVLSFLQE